jgi:RNA polymerase sigma factor (sigma-70 family)
MTTNRLIIKEATFTSLVENEVHESFYRIVRLLCCGLMSDERADQSIESVTGKSQVFATTHWSVVLAAIGQPSAQSEAALARLCQTYWYPLYAYVRRRGHSPEDARDLTQGFFATLLEKNYLACANRERGRFRTFLLTAINNFLHNQHERAGALKRGGGREFVSWEQPAAEERYLLEPAITLTPERIYEKRWAATLLEQVLARLRQEFALAGRVDLFDQLKSHLWLEDGKTPYTQLATRFNMTVVAIKVTVYRLRERYGDLLREQIGQTVADPAEVDDEIRHLLRVLSD